MRRVNSCTRRLVIGIGGEEFARRVEAVGTAISHVMIIASQATSLVFVATLSQPLAKVPTTKVRAFVRKLRRKTALEAKRCSA